MSVKIKLCGMTCEDDISLVNHLKPDFAGFVLFFPKSRRNLSVERAAELAAKLDGVKSVAVTVSPTPEQAEQIQSAGFDYLQVHGELSKETYNCCNIPIIRAFNNVSSEELEKCLGAEKIAAFLFDAAESGSGKTFDWDKLKSLDTGGKMVFLAGGLNPENVARAIMTTHPDVVDVSSGIERREGGKDPDLAEKFVMNARSV